MDDCKEIFARLSEYLDAELPPDACADIEAHIAGCAPCVEFVDSLKRSIALCRQFEPGELPAPLADKTRETLRAAYQKMLAGRARRP